MLLKRRHIDLSHPEAGESIKMIRYGFHLVCETIGSWDDHYTHTCPHNHPQLNPVHRESHPDSAHHTPPSHSSSSPGVYHHHQSSSSLSN